MPMPSSRFRGLIVSLGLSALCLVPGCKKAGAGDTHAPTSVDRVVMDAPASVRILEERTSYTFAEDGSYVHEVRRKFQILTRDGVDSWGSVGAGYSPWFEKRPVITATVTTPQGETVTLDPSTISDAPAYPDSPDVYSDARVVQAPLPAISVGAVVDETIVTETSRPFFADATYGSLIFQSDIPTDLVELVVDVPASWKLQYELRDIDAKTSEKASDGRRKYVFSAEKLDAIEAPEIGIPTDVARYPGVVFSTGSSWSKIATTYADRLDETLAGFEPPAEVVETIKKTEGLKAKVDVALAWVRSRVRYTGMEFGENAIIPVEPKEALARGYGDCKDQATLLAGVLRAAKVPATVAILRSGTGEDVRPGLPGLNQFNHAIVAITGKEPLWIDPTDEYARAGALPTGDQDRWALIVDRKTEALVKTPVLPAEANQYTEIRDVYLSPLGSARVVEHTTATGVLESSLRSNFDGPKESATENLGKYVENTYNAEKVGAFSWVPATDMSKTFTLDVEALEAGMGVTDFLIADTVLDWGSLWDWAPIYVLAGDKERKSPFAVHLLHQATVQWRVHPPEGFILLAPPKFQDIDLGVFGLKRDVKVLDDGTLEVTFQLTVAKSRLTPEEIEAAKKKLDRLDREPELRITFLPEGTKAAQEGDLRKAADLYRAAVKARPKSAPDRMRYALALLGWGMGDKAREEAAAASALDPDSAELWFQQALIAQSNEYGLAMKRGFDRDLVNRALRKTVEVGDEDQALEARVQLAVMNEYDDDGARFSSKANLDAALKAYDEIGIEDLTTFSGGEYLANAIVALLLAGRVDEAEARAAKIEPSALEPRVHVMLAAMKGGTVGALQKLEELGIAPAQRSQVLMAGVGVALINRRYDVVASLADAAATNSADPAKLRNQARMYGKAKPVDVASLPSKTPEDIARYMWAVVLDGSSDGIDCKAHPRLCSKDLAANEALSRETRNGVTSGFDTWLQRVTVDVSMSGLEPPTTEGNDKIGYHVTLRGEQMGAQGKVSAFVVKEKGQYRLRAVADVPYEIGLEALKLYQSGQKEGAKKWLDWLYQDNKPASTSPAGPGVGLRLWDEGKGDLELSVATLAAASPFRGAAGIKVLEKRLPELTGDTALNVQRALFDAYSEQEQWAKADKAVAAIRKARPDDKEAMFLEVWAAVELGKPKRALAVIDEGRKKSSRTEQFDEIEIAVYAQLGDLEKAQAKSDELLRKKGNDGDLLNETAWRSLYLGEPRDKDIEYALRSVQAGSTSARQHTLACVYFARGKLGEGLQAMNKTLAARPNGRPEGSDFVMLGMLAEQLGFPAEARALYQKVEKPEDGSKPSPTSSYTLAQLRIKGMKRK